MNTAQLTDTVRGLLEESAAWQLIATLFESPAAGGDGDRDWIGQVRALAARVEDRALARAARDAEREAGGSLYLAIFGPGGVVSPRQTGYSIFRDPGQVLASLREAYAAFGYAPRTIEPPDHVCVIAGFVAYLRMKEAYAEAAGDSEAAAITARTARFIEEHHLSTVAAPMAERLRAAGVAYLAGTAEALVARVGEPGSLADEPSGGASTAG